MSEATSPSDDFPDRLSPMLVKELRQGLRARTFIAMFLALQAFLALMILSVGAGSGSSSSGNAISAIIFATFSIAVLVLQPMRGLGSIASEVTGNTIDMMVLTRLSAWRIAFGKWVAIVSQSALLLCTIVPYLILRYFFGGMNLLAEMVLLAMIFIASMTLTAMTVGVSGSQSKILRGTAAIGGVVLLFMMISGLRFGGGVGDIFTTFDSRAWIGIGLFMAFSIYLGGCSLSLGAAMIAPAAENHSTLRRVVALGCMAALALAAWLVPLPSPEMMIFFVLLTALPALVLALSESTQMVPIVWVPFLRRGPMGRLAGLFLAPGWASGVLFSVLLIALCALTLFLTPKTSYGGSDTDRWVVLPLAFLGTLLLAGLLVSFFARTAAEKFSNFVLITICLAVLAMCVGGLGSSSKDPGYLWLFVWNPAILLVMMEKSTTFPAETLVIVSGAVNVTITFLLVLRAIHLLKQHRAVIGEASARAETDHQAAESP